MVKNNKSWPLRVLGFLYLDGLVGIARKDLTYVLAVFSVIGSIISQKSNFGG